MGLKIKKNSDTNIEKEIIDLEKEYVFLFPNDYRDFIINSNGGEADENQIFKFIDINLNNRIGEIEINNFYSIDELLYDLNIIYKAKKEDVHPVEDDIFLHKILRIADTYNDLDIGIGLKNDNFGNIYILDTPHGEKIKISNSFNEFINGFTEFPEEFFDEDDDGEEYK